MHASNHYYHPTAAPILSLSLSVSLFDTPSVFLHFLPQNALFCLPRVDLVGGMGACCCPAGVVGLRAIWGSCLFYSSEHQLLTCNTCAEGLTSQEEVFAHFQHPHSGQLALTFPEASSLTSGLLLRPSTYFNAAPLLPKAPVAGLPITLLFKCNRDSGCTAMFAKHKYLRQHHRREEETENGKCKSGSPGFEKVPCQRLNPEQPWFRVQSRKL